MPVIKTENLTHVYGRGTPYMRTAINNISIEINEGEFVGIIGHTGSGKSTLIQHLNGLLKPSSGSVFVDGADIWDKGKSNLKQLRLNVGLVFQYPEYQLFEETVFRDVAYGPKNLGLEGEQLNKIVEYACNAVGLEPDLWEKSPFELSGGQKRRAAIAGVLAMEPKVLILDEPAAGLDPAGHKAIMSIIREYHAAKKNTVILISHTMDDIAASADRVLVLSGGEVFDFDTVDRIFSRADELEKMGLSIPQVAKVFIGLKERGIPVNTGIYTIQAAREEIKRLIC
ncbi:MAG: energy-coupling factor transporter ATPase [Oscillospiraceae bacterium]|nr:energy-coupling factor transporter ATPase [Oscillospiraceae bacterium]